MHEYLNNSLLYQAIKYKNLFAECLRQQKLLEIQLEQNLIYNTISSEQMAESIHDMMLVSAQIDSKEPLRVSKQIEPLHH